ncbi:hypothetical protein JXB41_07305 [Candidatus Woesearchaeota archaeon]|nr:hypothetical protein [Candidatus Woesearchaeota archaeon]
MKLKKIILLILINILLLQISYAATIHGTVYDISLKKVKNIIVEVNSSPNQRYLAAEGTYSFELARGDYQITSIYENADIKMSTIENITISDEGDYVLDLFLFPDLEEEESLFEDIDFDISAPFEKRFNLSVLILPLALLMLFTLVLLFLRLKRIVKNEQVIEEKLLDNNIKDIVVLLEKNKGRMTQKQIRKEIPLSEAKISLMIAELESLGKIRKIKKGRGNIIILEKKQ